MEGLVRCQHALKKLASVSFPSEFKEFISASQCKSGKIAVHFELQQFMYLDVV